MRSTVHTRDDASLVLGQYRVTAALGIGGMGQVALAERVSDGARVALKRLGDPHTGDPRHARIARALAHEARIIETLDHPNVVSLLDTEIDDQGACVLVLEYVDGLDLSRLMAHLAAPMPLTASLYVIAEMLKGLAHAHDRGIVHRDVTPHNVLISRRCEVKVTDFGLARLIDEDPSSGLRGKARYIAPEQIQGKKLDPRADLYAVGVIAYELVTGSLLYKGCNDALIIARRAIGMAVPKPSECRAGLPAAIDDVVMTLMAHDRDDRYASARDALDALPPWAMGKAELRCVLPDPDGEGEPENEPAPEDWASAVDNADTSPDIAPPVRPPRARWLIAALVGAACVALGWLGGSREPVVSPPGGASEAPAINSAPQPAEARTPARQGQDVYEAAVREPAPQPDRRTGEAPLAPVSEHRPADHAEPEARPVGAQRSSKRFSEDALGRFLSGEAVFSLTSQAQTDDDVEVNVIEGMWLDQRDALLRVHVTNDSPTPYSVAAVRLLDQTGREVPMRVERFRPVAKDEPSLIGVVACDTTARMALRVDGADRLSGQVLTLELSEPRDERLITVTGIVWP